MAAPPSSSGFLTPVEAARAGWRLALSGRKGVGGLESQGRRGGPRTWRESCRGGKSLPKRRYKPPDGLFHDPLESYLENARWPLADGQQNGKLPPRQRMGAYYMRPRPYHPGAAPTRRLYCRQDANGAPGHGLMHHCRGVWRVTERDREGSEAGQSHSECSSRVLEGDA